MLIELLHASYFIVNLLKKRMDNKCYFGWTRETEQKLQLLYKNLVLYWYSQFNTNWNKQKPNIGMGERIVYIYFDENIKRACEKSGLENNIIEKLLCKESPRLNYMENVQLDINPGHVKFSYHCCHYDIYNKDLLIGYKHCFKIYFKFKMFQDTIIEDVCYVKLLQHFFNINNK